MSGMDQELKETFQLSQEELDQVLSFLLLKPIQAHLGVISSVLVMTYDKMVAKGKEKERAKTAILSYVSLVLAQLDEPDPAVEDNKPEEMIYPRKFSKNYASTRKK